MEWPARVPVRAPGLLHHCPNSAPLSCCRGPIEFDLAHAPPEVAEHYPGADQALARECRVLVLAMITAWRWDRDDDLPNGQQLGTDWLSHLRSLVDHRGPGLGR
jgi:hypothetical protein